MRKVGESESLWVQLCMIPFMSRYKQSNSGIRFSAINWEIAGYLSLIHLPLKSVPLVTDLEDGYAIRHLPEELWHTHVGCYYLLPVRVSRRCWRGVARCSGMRMLNLDSFASFPRSPLERGLWEAVLTSCIDLSSSAAFLMKLVDYVKSRERLCRLQDETAATYVQGQARDHIRKSSESTSV